MPDNTNTDVITTQELKIAARKLDGMLRVADISKLPSYRPGEVQIILGISDRHFRNLTDRYELNPITGALARPDCLDSYVLRQHRRVRYDELVAFMARNNTYRRINVA
jgi:hypothetical protein